MFDTEAAGITDARPPATEAHAAITAAIGAALAPLERGHAAQATATLQATLAVLDRLTHRLARAADPASHGGERDVEILTGHDDHRRVP